MYINIIAGFVVVALVYWGLKEFVRSRKSPATVLREEIAQRKERENRVAENVKRIRQEAETRMLPVTNGLEEMAASLPEGERPVLLATGEHGGVELLFLQIESADSPSAPSSAGGVRVSHRLARFTLDGAADELDEAFARYERFLVEHLDAEKNVVSSLELDSAEETLRYVARIMAKYVR